jgi:hypothetical protein
MRKCTYVQESHMRWRVAETRDKMDGKADRHREPTVT